VILAISLAATVWQQAEVGFTKPVVGLKDTFLSYCIGVAGVNGTIFWNCYCYCGYYFGSALGSLYS